MNALLWILQVLAALLFGSSGTMKVFFFDEISADYPTFEALPREVWTALGVLEIVCTIGLLVPSFLRWKPKLTVLAAGLLALETLLLAAVHLQCGEIGTMIMVVVFGLIMAFVAYGRSALRPIR